MQKDTYYIAAGFDWDEDTIISEATFAESPHKSFFVQDIPSSRRINPDFMARRETELSLERYRKDKCPSKPSRANSIFLNRNLEDAIKWKTRGSRANYNIYELSVCNEQNSCVTNYIWYNYCVRLKKSPKNEFRRIFGQKLKDDFVGSIEAYWDNSPTEDFDCPSENEILYIGTLVVVRRIV